MRVLLIDDLRDIKADVVARSYTEGIHALAAEPFDKLILDHDLASWEDGRERTGYDVVCFLEEWPQCRPREVYLVTASPVGLKRMAAGLEAMGYRRVTSRTFVLDQEDPDSPVGHDGEPG